MPIEILSGGDVYIGSATPSSGGGVPAVIEELNVTPSTSAQTITAPEGVDGYSPVNVSAVTSSIDANIQASNIKSGVSILGVTGTLTSGDEITATNNTGSAITNGDKVWVNQSGGSYTLEDYNVYEINCDKYGSPTISNSVASNFSTSNYLLTKNIIDTQSYNSWEFNIKIRTPSDVYSGKTGYGYYFCGATDNGGTYPDLNYSFLYQIYHNKFNMYLSSNGTSWDIPVSGDATILGNTDYFIKLSFDGTQYILSFSTDGITYTTVSSATSSLKMHNDKISFGKAFSNSPDTSFSGSIDFSQSYFIADGVKIWDGYTASGRINAPDTALTGTAAENITIGGTGDVEIGNVIEPTLGTKTITANGTYNASTDDLDGYSTVTVDVPSAPTKKYNLLDRVTDDSNNEIGTVSGFFTDANNVEYAVVCLDAQYRTEDVTWCSNTSTVVTDLPIYSGSQWGPWEAKETATFNTQKILDFCTANSYTSGACSHCRTLSFTIDGTMYYGQLPNMVELNDIVRNHTAINIADTTASSYSSYDFSEGRLVWSSSQYSNTRAWIASMFGAMQNTDKNGPYFVAPVLEIPNT